jgi:hypothetical protein
MVRNAANSITFAIGIAGDSSKISMQRGLHSIIKQRQTIFRAEDHMNKNERERSRHRKSIDRASTSPVPPHPTTATEPAPTARPQQRHYLSANGATPATPLPQRQLRDPSNATASAPTARPQQRHCFSANGAATSAPPNQRQGRGLYQRGAKPLVRTPRT